MAQKRVDVVAAVFQILSYNKGRTSWVIHNLGPSTLFFSNDRGVTITNGFPVPSGGFASKLRVDGDDPEMAIYGIALAAGADLGVNESFEEIPIDKLLRLLEARS